MAKEKFHAQDKFVINKTEVQYYISVVAHKIEVMRRRIKEISQQAYTSPSPVALADILQKILSRFFDELRDIDNKLDYFPPGDALRKAQTINFIIDRIIPQLIEAIESTNIEAPVASILEAYEQITQQVRFGSQTIIYPTWEHNASFEEMMEKLKLMTKYLDPDVGQAIFSGAPPFFTIITYPKSDEDLVLRQALIAHEIGHFIDTALNWSEELFDEKLFTPSDYNKIVMYVEENAQEDEVEEMFEQIRDLIERMAAYWVKEAVADFIAVCILGPAYLFAFDEFSFAPRRSINKKISSSHPPIQLRKNIIGGLVKKIQTDPIISTKEFHGLDNDEKDIYHKIVKRINTISQNSVFENQNPLNHEKLSKEIIVYFVLENMLQNIIGKLSKEKLGNIIEKKWFCKPQDIIDALSLQELLYDGLTPSELYLDSEREPSFSAIMNSGWFFLIYNEKRYRFFNNADKNLAKPDEIRRDFISLNNLIAKAVENLRFKEEFNRRKKDYTLTKLYEHTD